MAESELPPNDHSNHQSPYVGRWIATINGRVISQGGTPDQARQAAKASRFKETPNISYMSTKPPIFNLWAEETHEYAIILERFACKI